jgi:Dolichyl-phosphate-mannose-protein mannosyltransferase
VLYVFVQQLFKDRSVSFVAATLFATAAVGVDAIFWKCANSTLIAFFFYILSLFWFVKFRQEGNRRSFAISIAAFAVAIFSKEEAASFPAILILLDWLLLGERKLVKIVARVAPYCGLIVFYLVSNRIVFNVLLGVQPEPAKFFKIRPLHSLFSSWSVFFLSPEGGLESSNLFIYVTAVLLLLAIYFVQARKQLLFAYGWIFFTFIPQSFTSLGQFQPKYLFNSMSRYLFLPSAGAAIVIALVMAEVGRRWGKKTAVAVFLAFLVFYLPLNFSRVRDRGEQWRVDAEPVNVFVRELQRVMPLFPSNSYVFVINPPTGRAYVQQSLRAFYKNPSITWIVDPRTFRLKEGERGFLIGCQWENESKVRLIVYDFASGAPLFSSSG